MRLLAPFLLLALTGCAALAPPDDWTRHDTRLEIAYQVVAALDGAGTARIRRTPDIYETGTIARRILGPQPDPAETVLYFAAAGLSHYLISRHLPPKWRPWWQGGTTAYEAHLVARHCRNGLC